MVGPKSPSAGELWYSLAAEGGSRSPSNLLRNCHSLNQDGRITAGGQVEAQADFAAFLPRPCGQLVLTDRLRERPRLKQGRPAAARKEAVAGVFDAERAALHAELGRHAIVEFRARTQFL